MKKRGPGLAFHMLLYKTCWAMSNLLVKVKDMEKEDWALPFLCCWPRYYGHLTPHRPYGSKAMGHLKVFTHNEVPQ